MSEPFYRYYITAYELIHSADIDDMFPDDPIIGHLMQYIGMMYGESYVLTLDSSKDTLPEHIGDLPKVQDRLYQFISWLNTTKDYYEPLIKAQQDNMDNILADATVKSQTRFNDTPTTQGEYEGNDYTTNITTTTANVPESVRAKLAGLTSLIKDYYGSWLKEFERTFIYIDVNLEDTTEDF